MSRDKDPDPIETLEWQEALRSVVQSCGPARGEFLLQELVQEARHLGIAQSKRQLSAYQNTIPIDKQEPYPGDLELEERLTAIVRWNALAMVVRANNAFGELGGHIASYASAAEIFELGFNHFFRADGETGRGDLVFFQPHSAPGVYARAYLEGRLSEDRLANFRREVGGNGLCSYCHPWLMPDFWQFPTGSMGLGPITAAYQARFMRYLEHRSIAETAHRHVWGIFGDGEMDEPESVGALALAAREQLDNLTFIINCNLQRLDGPVRGNGQIIQELESIFAGAGWNVIKVLWGSNWDAIFARDTSNVLLHSFASIVDGQFQTLGSKDGNYNESHFFGRDPELRKLAAHLSHREIDALKRGGHDFVKLYAAFAAARNHRGAPSVILAKTKKGYGMGGAGESRMTSHQKKNLDSDSLRCFRDRFRLPLSDADLSEMRFYRPSDDSEELKYLRSRRAALGGYLPQRRSEVVAVDVPPLHSYARFALEANGKEMSTTMALVRLLRGMLKNREFQHRIVPIVADEARTFGMADLFRQIGIYSPHGQLYEPEDAESLFTYRESEDGQLLEEGITEAGAMSSWIAAATSYSTHNLPMLPFYLYYSMFGFQRVGDLIWAAADQRARGFLIGGTAGRTTLNGEGLQHQDGSSHVVAATIPTCRTYDPTFAYEVAVILDHGARRMLEERADEFYYVTVMNERYPNPSLPEGAEGSIIKGMYKLSARNLGEASVQLLGSGAILLEVEAAAELLAQDWNVSTDVWSVTSYSELAKEARHAERWSRLHPERPRKQSYVQQCLGSAKHIVAASDYVRAWPQLISPYVPSTFTALGTDGFGRSDTRPVLRQFFEVDRHHITVTALYVLARSQEIPTSTVSQAIFKYGIDPEKCDPATA